MVGTDVGATVLVGAMRVSVGVLVALGAEIGVTVLVGAMLSGVAVTAHVLLALGISVGIVGDCPVHAMSRISAENRNKGIAFTQILNSAYIDIMAPHTAVP